MKGIQPAERAATTPSSARPELKNGKSAAKPHQKSGAVKVEAHPSNIQLNPVGYCEEAAGAAAGDQVTHLLPSLGAEYRGLWKCCQAENGAEPQNLWVSVSNSSTGSGVTAGFHYSCDVPFKATEQN